MYDIVNI